VTTLSFPDSDGVIKGGEMQPVNGPLAGINLVRCLTGAPA
jgi:hypothetical protein